MWRKADTPLAVQVESFHPQPAQERSGSILTVRVRFSDSADVHAF
jgi:hypothetical protein